MSDQDEGEVVTEGTPTLADLAEWVLDRPAPAPNVSRLVDLVAVGTVLHAWRNSPVEDAHASAWCPLTDGEMMWTNAATTRLVREFVVEFFRGVFEMDVPTTAVDAPAGLASAQDDDSDGVVAVENCSVLDEFDQVDLLVEELLDPLHVALIRRVLPCGYTVAEATGEFYDDLVEHIVHDLDTFAYVTEQHGLRAALYLKATAGGGQRWWLTPAWPDTVAALRTVLADPTHDHWKISGYPDTVSRPDRCGEEDQLADVLLQGPDRLTAAEADWCVDHAGITYVLHHVRRDT